MAVAFNPTGAAASAACSATMPRSPPPWPSRAAPRKSRPECRSAARRRIGWGDSDCVGRGWRTTTHEQASRRAVRARYPDDPADPLADRLADAERRGLGAAPGASSGHSRPRRRRPLHARARRGGALCGWTRRAFAATNGSAFRYLVLGGRGALAALIVSIQAPHLRAVSTSPPERSPCLARSRRHGLARGAHRRFESIANGWPDPTS